MITVKTIVVFALLSVISGFVNANAVGELTTVLKGLQGDSPLQAEVSAKAWFKQGKGDDAIENEGIVDVHLDDNEQGLSVRYSRDIMALLIAEEEARTEDPDAKAPTFDTVNAIQISQLQAMMSAGESLMRDLKRGTLIDEQASIYKGRKSRLLTFQMSRDVLNKEQRKYIKKFDASIRMWLDDEGVPIASEREIYAKGRAFVVVGFEFSSEDSYEYTVINDRLVVKSHQQSRHDSGGGQTSESRLSMRLSVDSSP